MPELVMVRHGETPWNAEELFRGREDIPLSDRGHEQAAVLADYLGCENIRSLYTSPLQRAAATAVPLAERSGLEPVRVNTLTDMDFGAWQGLPLSEVRTRYPELYRTWQDRPEQVSLPGGERLDEVSGRVIPFLQDAMRHNGDGAIAIVTHRVILKVMVCFLLGVSNASFWKFRLDTAGVTRFQVVGGRAVLTAFNDTSFLGTAHPAGNDF